MKKIYVEDFSNSRRVEVYYASEVDARIQELEKALREIVRTAATIPGSVCGGDLHPVVAQYLVSARSVESARSLLGL